MYCHNCKSKINDGSKFCIFCGTATALERKIEPEKPKSNSLRLSNSITKSEIFVGGFILTSLSFQAIILVRNLEFLEQTRFVYPIVCAVLAITIFIINRIYELKRIIVHSLIAFCIAPLPLWIIMVLSSRGEYDALYYLLVGLIPTIKLVVINALLYFSVILAWFFGYTIINKRKKTTK